MIGNKMKTLIRKILKEQTSKTVLVAFGGIDYATAKWMNQQIPQRIKDSKTVITKSYTSKTADVVKELNKIDYNRLEVVGFSAGGKDVFELVKAIDINFLGLIDPSVPTDWKVGLDNFPAGKDSILFFDNSNWIGNKVKGTRERQPLLATAMEDKGMEVKEEDLRHSNFPKIFFETYM